MSRRKVTALALIAAGALVFTPVTIPSTRAAAVTDDAQPRTLAAQRDDAQSGGDAQPRIPQDPATASDVDGYASDDTPTTIIVQLEEGDVGIPWDKRVFGLSTDTKHAEMKARIESEVDRVAPGSAVTVLREYSHALDGFALEAPASSLEAIRATEGVKAAFVEQTYDPTTISEEADDAVLTAIDPSVLNSSTLEMIRANQTSLKGDRQVIEIIDTGLVIGHAAFAGSMDGVDVRMSQADVEALTSKLPHGKGGRYVSKKIPFVYDYADEDDNPNPGYIFNSLHGTHVAGIAAANAPELRGVAPNAQIIAAKVAGDGSGIQDRAVLDALDDALILKPDIINLSLVRGGGMSSEAGSVYDGVLKALTDEGITVNVCAGNEGSAAYGTLNGSAAPYATEPDTSTVTEPGSFKPSLTVASVDNVLALPYLTYEGQRIFYRAAVDWDDQAKADLRAIPEGTYRVIDAGAGDASTLERLVADNQGDLSDVILLENGGGNGEYNNKISAWRQVSAAESLSARPAALMLGDPDQGVVPYAAIIDEHATLPTVTITNKDHDTLAEALRSSASGSVTITLTYSDQVPVTDMPMVYPTSSWGVSPDLTLKPEITAPGGNVVSAGYLDQYVRMTGTSQASPHVAGVAALVRERIASDPLFARMSHAEKDAVVANILMGTAHPLQDVEQRNGTYYSPRRVGAGLVDAVAATTTAVYPTVEGASDPSRPKADLGDGTQGWSFTVRLTNLSGDDHTYTLGGQALSEITENGYFTQHSKNWANQGISLVFSANALRVPARSSASVTVTVTPQAEFASYAAANAPKGTFIDGAVTFASADGAPDLTVPYMGFYGSWGDPSVFDAQGSDFHADRSSLINLATRAPLDEPRVGLDGARYVVSRSPLPGAPTSIAPRTVLLRNVPVVTYTYKNEAGTVVRSYTRHRARKYPFDGTAEVPDTVDAQADTAETPHTDAAVFDGFDASGTELPDGPYTLTIEAASDGPSSTTHRQSYELMLDTQAPVVTTLDVRDDAGERTLVIDITDSSPLAGYGFSAITESEPAYSVTEGLTDAHQDDGTYTSHYEIAWKDLPESLTATNPAALTLYAWDAGKNRTTAHVNLAGIPMTALSLTPQSSSLIVGQTTTLRADYEPANATVTGLVWSSSNEAVATVDDQGHVRAVGTGSATITAADTTQSSVSASAQVSVRAVSSWTGIELSTSSLTLQAGQAATVEAFLASTFKGRTVTWKLVPASLGTVTPSRDTLSATVTASSTEGSGTLRATVSNRYGRARSVSIPVTIEGEASRDFVIDASGVLTSYEGSSPDVTIPDTVTVIAPSAFDKARRVIRSVRIPASVREIQADAFASTALTSVTFDDTRDYPSQLTTVGERAFASTALTSIVLPGAVTTIGARAFDGAMSLTELEIPDSVQYSGGLANTGLETVEFGTQIRKISSRGTSLTAPQHLIVRGGVQGVVDYEESASDTSLMSAFFGEGITDITLSGSFPRVLVLPSTTTQFALYSYLLGGRPDDIDVYVADAQGSPAWATAENTLRQARLDTARIHRYTPATVTVSGVGITEADDGYELSASVGTPTQITASVTGGVPGGYQMRATQVSADGTETPVLDWADMTANADSASALLSWNPSSSDTTLRIEVRDATHLRHPVTVALAGSPQPDPTPQVGSWSHNGSCWSYRYADGTVERSSTLTIDAQVYRFGANGCAKTGWVLDGDSWYYHSSTGAQQSGWLTLGTDTYYLDPTTGAMATGWITDGGAWYYLQPGTGAMATGWVRIGWKWYHFSDTGQLL